MLVHLQCVMCEGGAGVLRRGVPVTSLVCKSSTMNPTRVSNNANGKC